MELAGTSAVITGGGNGIGRAIALALARDGANVAVADVERDAAESVAHEVEALGVRAVAAQVDVAREEDIERLADEAWEAFGSVELLFNNAGVGAGRAPAYGFSADDVRWILSVNVEGVLNGIRVFAPRFIEGGRESRIINTGSEHASAFPSPAPPSTPHRSMPFSPSPTCCATSCPTTSVSASSAPAGWRQASGAPPNGVRTTSADRRRRIRPRAE